MRFGELLVGCHGREDSGVATLRAIRWRDGKVLWEVPDFGMAHLVRVDDALLIQRQSGELLLAHPDAKDLNRAAGFQVGVGPMRSMPALLRRRWIVREADQPKKARWRALDLPREEK